MATLSTRVIRRAARLPLVLYRLRLGRLFGESLLLLEHTGRVSGRPRRTVLEVVGRLPGDRLVVASGRGDRADWYRNIRAEPRVHVSVGQRRVPAVARPVPGPEAAQVLATYRATHPRRWPLVATVLSRTLPGSDRDRITGPPLVEIRLDTT